MRYWTNSLLVAVFLEVLVELWPGFEVEAEVNLESDVVEVEAEVWAEVVLEVVGEV